MSWLAEIAKNEGGRLRFDRFMELALFHPAHGYYTRRIRGIGQSGDFSTSTTLSPALGKAVFRWLEAEAKYLGFDPLIIIEPGIGTGALAKVVLSQMRPWSRVRYFGVDLRPKSTLLDKSLSRPPPIPFIRFDRSGLRGGERESDRHLERICGCFSMPPIGSSRNRLGRSYLRYEDDQWRQELSPAQISFPCSALDRGFALGQTIEVHERFRDWLATLSAELTTGAILTIDYGGQPDEIYRRRPDGTLRGYFRQQRIEGNEIFHRAGFQDLTADVNFADLQVWGDECDFKIVNYLTQREFVARWCPGALKDPGRQQHSP